jgi:predicted  nucleic acid-binding Zn-ribbon protein
MLAHPCSDTGRLQSEVSDLNRKVSQCAQSHEVHQTQRNVDSLEHQLREVSATLDGLRSELQALQEDNEVMKRTLEENGLYL